MPPLRLFVAACLCATALAGCPLSPTAEQTSDARHPGDGGYRILVSGEYDKYIPNAVYTIGLQGSGDFDRLTQFRRFTLSVDSQHAPFNPAARVGFFQIFPDSLSEFNEECVNTISEVSDYPKSEVQVMWRAPPAGSGCVIFTAMVMQSRSVWYAEDGQLSRTFCEMSPKETESLDELRCCACDEAKYKMSMEGIWSNLTHPKDFPESAWLTHFSDVVGASHSTNFSFWGRHHTATDGFRQLAEWGSASGLENELRAKAKYLRTYVKAAGLWYPNVNSNTSADFKVDRKHPLLSLASMVGPSPDWIVGVSKLNLCQRDCTWIRSMAIDLYPWDAGTDNGITYMSPNSETRPRETMKPITTMYPEDPRSPFYDPSGRPMLPLARLYLDRVEITRRSCSSDREVGEEAVDFNVAEQRNNGETERPECTVTAYSDWSACSVSCGRGQRTRTRAYKIPEQAAAAGCSRQLVSKEACVASEKCGGESNLRDKPLFGSNEGECEVSDWGKWSDCSAACGASGFKTRWRRLKRRENRKKCYHVKLTEKDKCIQSPCTENKQEQANEQTNDDCKVSDWSNWSPCSVSCGNGMKTRTRLLLVVPDRRAECSKRVNLVEQRPCLDQADCTFGMATAKVICMEKVEPGPCRGYFEHWTFNPEKLACVPFVYGGCSGNKNNFPTLAECSKTCNVIRDALKGDQPVVQLLNHVPHQSYDNQKIPTELSSSLSPLIPADCQVSEWSPWTPCNVSCGSGRVASRRYILRQPENGGKPCTKRLQRHARCQLAPCKDH